MPETKTYTPQGFKALQDELDYLVNVKVEENKKDISTARAFGDLSENSEYDEAKNEQAEVERHIAELEDILENIEIIKSTGKKNKIQVGSTVKVYDVEFDEEVTYTIVGSTEANSIQRKISNESPVGSALMGKKVGDTVMVETQVGQIEYKVLEITRVS